jgi:hypothetical protein
VSCKTYHKTTPHTNKRPLTPRAPTRRQVPVVRIDRQSVDVTFSLEMHDRLRLRRPGIKDTSLIPKRLVQQRSRVRFPDPADGAGVGGGGFAQATDRTVVFFGGNRQAEQHALGLGQRVEVFCSGDGFIVEELGQTVGLRLFFLLV